MGDAAAVERHVRIFGARLRSLRKKRGISAKTLGTLSGYADGSVITQIEKGEYNPTLEKIVRMADVLGVEPAYLLMDGPEVLDGITVEMQRYPIDVQQAIVELLYRIKHCGSDKNPPAL